jgi:hypothetical protein
MRRLLLLCYTLPILLPSFCFSQSRVTHASKPPQLQELVGLSGVLHPMKLMLHRTKWELGYIEKHQGRSAQEAAEGVRAWLAKGYSSDEATHVEYDLVSKYKEGLIRLLDGLKYIGDDEGRFLYDDESIPVGFARTNGSLTLVLSAIASGNVYNTLRTSDKTRASKVVASVILPVIRDLTETLPTDQIKYFAIEVCYGSKAFSDEDLPGAEGEIVVAVVPSERAKQFAAASLTREELLNSSDVYIFTHEASALEKVKLSFD